MTRLPAIASGSTICSTGTSSGGTITVPSVRPTVDAHPKSTQTVVPGGKSGCTRTSHAGAGIFSGIIGPAGCSASAPNGNDASPGSQPMARAIRSIRSSLAPSR